MIEIGSPMGGSVWKIEVQKGDTVAAGEVLIILESMKMEIPIEATEGGTIKEINAAEGDFVQEGDIVISIKN